MDVRLKSYRKEREKDITDKLYKGMVRAVALVERQAKMNVSKTGDEHPQIQSHQLWDSIGEHSKVEESGGNIVGTVGTHIEHGKYLEYGTVNMQPYPWLFPAIEEKRNDIKEALLDRGFSID